MSFLDLHFVQNDLTDEINAQLATTPDEEIDHGALAAALVGLARSSHWHKVEQAFLQDHPTCAVCGGTTRLQVHHKFDFHEAVLLGRPDAELDPRNLVTLCADPNLEHHLLLGHLDDYQSFNRDVDVWISRYRQLPDGWTNDQIRAYAPWQTARLARPAAFREWSDDLKASERAWLDANLPPDPAVLSEYGLEIEPW